MMNLRLLKLFITMPGLSSQCWRPFGEFIRHNLDVRRWPAAALGPFWHTHAVFIKTIFYQSFLLLTSWSYWIKNWDPLFLFFLKIDQIYNKLFWICGEHGWLVMLESNSESRPADAAGQTMLLFARHGGKLSPLSGKRIGESSVECRSLSAAWHVFDWFMKF